MVKRVKAIVFCLCLVILPAQAFSLGGNGATCNPSTASWGSCALAPVPFDAYVTNTVNVPGGNYSAPYQTTQANTRYVLQGDMNADSSAFIIKHNYVIIDLNGFTITYNNVSPGEGVTQNAWNLHHAAIRNGTIIQGTANVGKVVSVSVFSGGSGYTLNDVLTLDGPTDATVTVTGVSAGVITSVAITDGGLGFDATFVYGGAYQNGYYGTVTGGTGTGALIHVGSTVSEGNIYGQGRNPISTYNSANAGSRAISNLHVSNLYLKYYGRDVGGVICSGSDGIYEQLTIEDMYEFGTIKHRDQGIEALDGAKLTESTGVIYRNNTIVNSRHRGIVVGNSGEAYGNYVTTRTIATNGAAIGARYERDNISIHDNTIIGRGEHPVGVGIGGGNGNHGVEVYNNLIDLRITAIGVEYGSAYLSDPSKTYGGNSASGVRLTWDAYDVNVYNNQIDIITDSRYVGTYSPTGGVAYITGGGKGLFIGAEVVVSVATFSGNIITVTGDGSPIYGVTCAYNYSDSLFVINNTITSSGYNIVLGDEYGTCSGYPLFAGNTFIKSGSSTNYRTFANTYNSLGRDSQARIVDSVYQNGAAENSYILEPGSAGITDLYFGAVSGGEYVYSYRLHDANNTSSTLLTETFDPPISLLYANPGDLPPEPVCDSDHPSLCLTQETCEWASLYWYNDMCNAAPYVPPACGYDHPELCMTQGNCEAVSGLSWCDNACQVGSCGGEPPPAGSARRLSLAGRPIKLVEPGP